MPWNETVPMVCPDSRTSVTLPDGSIIPIESNLAPIPRPFLSQMLNAGWERADQLAFVPAFGNAYEYNESGDVMALTSSAVFYQWGSGTGASLVGGPTDSLGNITWSATNSALVVGAQGLGSYMITCSGVGAMGAAHELRAVVFKNDTGADAIRADFDIANLATYTPFVMSGVISLAAGDQISVRFSSDTDSQTWTLRHCALSMVRIG